MIDIFKTRIKLWDRLCPVCNKETVYKYGDKTEQCLCVNCKHEFDSHEAKERKVGQH